MIELVRADITELDVDAIVNAANTSLLGGSGIDGAIHKAAGPELLDACRKIGRCKVGQAVRTPGFKLPARWVIHTVGSNWNGGDQGEPAALESAYEASFARAKEEPSIRQHRVSFDLDGPLPLPDRPRRRHRPRRDAAPRGRAGAHRRVPLQRRRPRRLRKSEGPVSTVVPPAPLHRTYERVTRAAR